MKFTSRRLPAAVNRETGSCLYRVLRESLNNIARHARATRVSVRVEGAAGGIKLTVKDRGVGFAAESLRTNVGLGIVSMTERVRLVHGTLRIDSVPAWSVWAWYAVLGAALLAWRSRTVEVVAEAA